MDGPDLISAHLHPIHSLACAARSNLGRPSRHQTACRALHGARHPPRFLVPCTYVAPNNAQIIFYFFPNLFINLYVNVSSTVSLKKKTHLSSCLSSFYFVLYQFKHSLCLDCHFSLFTSHTFLCSFINLK